MIAHHHVRMMGGHLHAAWRILMSVSASHPQQTAIAQVATLKPRYRVGDTVGRLEMTQVDGKPVSLRQMGKKVHLQFRRFAGCPICNLHLRSIVKHHTQIEQAGIVEIVVFHSSREEMQEYTDLPFAVIADPQKALYKEFGIEKSWRSMLHPRAMWAGMLGILGRRASLLTAKDGMFGMPADFLLDETGKIIACHYGKHADDQWSVQELLAQT